MAINAFRKSKFVDLPVSQLQNAIALWTSQLTNNPILSGRLIEDIDVTSGSTIIDHGLKAPVRGYIITKVSANVNIWCDPANQTLPNTQLVLDSSGTATISLYVF
jgi:hypothetical protein